MYLNPLLRRQQVDVGRSLTWPGGLGLGAGLIGGQQLSKPQPTLPSTQTYGGFYRYNQRAFQQSVLGWNRLNYYARHSATHPSLYNPFRRKPGVLEPVPKHPDFLQERVPGFTYYYRRGDPGRPFAVVPKWDLPLRLEIPGRGEFPRWGFPWWPAKVGDYIGRLLPTPPGPQWPDIPWEAPCRRPPKKIIRQMWNPYRKRFEPVQQIVNCHGKVLQTSIPWTSRKTLSRSYVQGYKKPIPTRLYTNNRRYRTSQRVRYRRRRRYQPFHPYTRRRYSNFY